ncbi:uncharacterized protein LOC123295748 [Chrysoperla carnea]|uniref:uncharacterized protein LOC123295748 n=1 Tax=Chrysoperla carnea TaxID=189513 RepID=UPI001D083EF6|nr:uncharacterized protein LOC123295748 [Chrysoperla carnea]
MFTIKVYVSLIILHFNVQNIFCENYTTEIIKNLNVNKIKLGINGSQDSLIEPNMLCLSQSGETGVCRLYRVCINQGGQASGNCRLSGPRVCCITNSQSGAVNNNPFYYQNPGYPSAITPTSDYQDTYSIYKAKPSYVQVRLDFIQFNIQGDLTGTGCSVDTFSVYNGEYRTPSICGTTSGTSLYVRFSGNNPIQLSIRLDSLASAESRLWNIRITQLSS